MGEAKFWPLVPLPLLILALVSSSQGAPNSVYESLIECMKKQNIPAYQFPDIVFDQSNPQFSSVFDSYVRNARYNTSSSLKPLIIITPRRDSEIQAAVSCTKSLGYQLKIRSGGHDYEGLSYSSSVPFFLLDMFNFRSVDVNVDAETAVTQAGATLGEVYYRIWERSKVHGFPAGVCPTVGVGGHVSGGGYGNMIRKYGLSSDQVIDAVIVNANGNLLDRKAMGEDLFWAIRGGGGGSFGVIVSFTVRLVPVPATVTVFRVEKLADSENATDLVHRWQYVAPVTDNDLFMRVLIQPSKSKIRKGELTIRVSVVALFLGDAARLLALTDKELPELGLKKEDCKEMSWIESVLWWDKDDLQRAPEALLDRNPNSATFLKRKSDYVQQPIPKEGFELLWKQMIGLGKVGLVFNPYGGKMNEVAADATAMPHRKGNLYKVQHSVSWKEAGPEADKNFIKQIRKLYEYLTPFVSKNPRSTYLNYRDLDIGANHNNTYEEGKVYGEKYFNGNFDRLVKVKTAVDPDNFFRHAQSIPPLPKIA